jgi:hypothetical protein
MEGEQSGRKGREAVRGRRMQWSSRLAALSLNCIWEMTRRPPAFASGTGVYMDKQVQYVQQQQ